MRTKKLTDKVILETLEKNKEILKKYGVKKIGLFGSFIRGEQKKNSDIDFLVEFELSQFGENFKGLYEAFMDLSNYLENLFRRKVELITKGSLSPYIQPYIEKEVKWYETELAIS
jgi:predicted nucleotidyltransferase